MHAYIHTYIQMHPMRRNSLSKHRNLFREAHITHTYIHTDAPNADKFIERAEEFIQGGTHT
jgi:hypothetical protein